MTPVMTGSDGGDSAAGAPEGAAFRPVTQWPSPLICDGKRIGRERSRIGKEEKRSNKKDSVSDVLA